MEDQNLKPNHQNSQRYRLFLKLYRQYEDFLFGFILKLIPNFSIAEDIMQETTITMWEKFDSFQEGTNFIAWAKQIARYKVMGFLRQKANSMVFHLSDNLVDQITHEEPATSSHGTYFEALHQCVDKLGGRNREIIKLRYLKDMKLKEISTITNTTVNTLSKQFARIHYHLKECIDQTVRAWELTNE